MNEWIRFFAYFNALETYGETALWYMEEILFEILLKNRTCFNQNTTVLQIQTPEWHGWKLNTGHLVVDHPGKFEFYSEFTG